MQEAAGAVLGRTDGSGRLTIQCRIPCRLRIDAEGFQGKYVELSASATIQLEPVGADRAGHRHRLSHSAGHSGKPGHHAGPFRVCPRHHCLDHDGRKDSPVAGCRAFPPLQFAGGQPDIPGHQHARPRVHIRQPHPCHAGRCSPQRRHRRMDPLGRAAGAVHPAD